MCGVHLSKTSLLLCFLSICKVVECMTKLEFQFFETGVPWNTGFRLCRDNGGQLMKIRSKEILNVLQKFRPSGGWSDDFWVGLNKNSNNEVIFDDCEPTSSWTNWDSSPANDKPCVMLKKDELKWINEVCSKEVHVMCEMPKGPCTYESKKISCPSSNSQTISSSSSSECRTQCEQNKDSNHFNCWAYKWDGSVCTVYFSENPYFCDTGSSATVDTYIRVCFSYQSQSLSFPKQSGEDSDNPSSRTCSSWNPPTTTTSTTKAMTTTEAQTTTESPTTTVETTTTVQTTTDAQTTLAQETTVETTSEADSKTIPTEHTTSESPTILAQGTTVETTPEIHHTTDSQSTSTEQTTSESPTTLAQETTVETTPEIHHTTDSQTTSTEQTTSETAQTTAEAQSSTTPKTQSTTNAQTVEHETSSNPFTITESSSERFESSACVCDFCGDRNKTIVEKEIKEIVSKLTVDVQVLSATRRKKESQPDSRPSARSIGYLGIVLFVSLFGGIFIMDIKKLLQDIGLIKP